MARNTKGNTQPSTVEDEEDYSDVPEAAGTSWMVGEDRPSKVSKDVAVVRYFSDTDLSEVDSWDTALSFVEGALGDVANAADELGTGFKVLDEDEKEALIGQPLILMQWAFYDGDFGEFVAINAIRRYDNGSISKVVINDGSTGIRLQLKEYTKKTGRSGGLGVPKGLTISRYYFDEETGQVLTKAEVAEYISKGKKPKPAHTFYLDTSA